MRSEQCKQEERRKEDLATRRRILTAILGRVPAPLTSADLDPDSREFVNRLPQEYRTIPNQRAAETPKGERPKSSAEINTTRKNLDEVGYSRLLVEISLLDAAHNPFSRGGATRLETVAKRYRVNVEKIAESVGAEFAPKRKKRLERQETKGNGHRNRSRPVAATTNPA
jgi:hypothetical protein